MFDFEVWDVFGPRHTAAEGLSWRPLTAADIAEAKAEKNIDDLILTE